MARLDIPNKKNGDPVPASEYNAVIAAINESACICHVTTEEYFKIPSVDRNTLYICHGKDDLIDYFYIGNDLIAKRDKGGGPTGFPLNFPIVF